MDLIRYIPLYIAGLGSVGSLALAGRYSPWWMLAAIAFALLLLLGLHDLRQRRHGLLRNYPIIGHMRFILESIRPEIRQYFIEGEQDELPFSQEQRSLIYRRAKNANDALPFGTVQDVDKEGYSWIGHSIQARTVAESDFRVLIGGKACKQPYNASVFNISGMSYGALSGNAIMALNRGAALGGFAHNTGEGSISSFHREYGGDLIWQIATGYFGCRTEDGHFDPEAFQRQAMDRQVKMIEIKLSQGAKPGHGGVLPKAKITPEISAARGVPMGKDCISPPHHSAFSTPLELMSFLQKLRDLSGGKPVGLKMAIGNRFEFMAIVKAMRASGIAPDFIVVDGGEGGTGAAPAEMSNHVGMPMVDALRFVHNTLLGAGMREDIRLGCSGKMVSGYDLYRVFAMGADYVMGARSFMFSIGCIQARSCHTNECPAGIATQDPKRQRAIIVSTISERASSFHKNTLHALGELLGAAGLERPNDTRLWHLHMRSADGQMVGGDDFYPTLEAKSLWDGTAPSAYQKEWGRAQAQSFASVS